MIFFYIFKLPIDQCFNCKVPVKFLDLKAKILKASLVEELLKHGHKKNRKIKKTKKIRNVNQTKMELMRHYCFSHFAEM